MAGNQLICGYLVVRKPHVDILYPPERGPLDYPPRRVGRVWYQGFCRLQWPNLEEDFYRGTLSSELHAMLSPIIANPGHATTIPLCQDYRTASLLLTYSNLAHGFDELIAIHSDKLAQATGAVQHAPAELHLLGYDLTFIPDTWPLLADGYFLHPDAFVQFAPYINANGLFDANVPERDYYRAYIGAVQRGLAEPLPFDGEGLHSERNLEKVAVYRVPGDGG